MSPFRYEISAGGLVTRGKDGILMVQVENLKGEVVWTFPKGHIEKGEDARTAALREVQEETGWTCSITDKKPFQKVRYFFKWKGTLIKKEVVWFRMTPRRKTGEMDPDEILKTGWFTMKEAARKAIYGSDKKLLKSLGAGKKEGAKRGSSSRRPPRSSGPRSSATLRSRGT